MRSDYQLRHSIYGKLGSLWSRQTNEETRRVGRTLSYAAGSSGLLRHLDAIAAYALGEDTVIVDDTSFRFLDGNFAVIGRSQSAYLRGEVGDLSNTITAVSDPTKVVAYPQATAVDILDSAFMDAIAVDGSFDTATDWYLIPVPAGMTPVVIESSDGEPLVSGIDFSAHNGYIAMRADPARVLPVGLVRVITAYVKLPQPYSFILGAPADRRCSKYLMEYAKKSQSIHNYKRAAAEFCGMYVFPEPDVVLSAKDVPGATVYVTAALGALRIDYPHTPLRAGAVIEAGTIVSNGFTLVTAKGPAAFDIMDPEAPVSLDGVLPIKGLSFKPGIKVLVDGGQTTDGKRHVSFKFDGGSEAIAQLNSMQRTHELETGNYLSDELMQDGQLSKLVDFGALLNNFYGEQLIVARFEFLTPIMNKLLKNFLVEYKPCSCVVVIAEPPSPDEIS